MGHGIVYSLASATSQERHAATLKSAETAVYDKQGQLIPLSERFELKNKWLGRVMSYKPLDGAEQQPVMKEPDVIQGLEGYSIDDVKSYVKNSIDEILEDAVLSEKITIKNITVVGSRSRGEAHEGSDLDILVEYEGNFREDALFDILHEEGLDLELNNGTAKYAKLKIGAKIIPWSLETNNTKILNLQMESKWLSTRTIVERSPDRAPDEEQRIIAERGALVPANEKETLDQEKAANETRNNSNEIVDNYAQTGMS